MDDSRREFRALAEDARRYEGSGDWQDLASRARAAAAVARVERAAIDGALVVDAASDGFSDAWPSDYVEAFERLGHAETYGVESQAGLYGLFHHLSEDQLNGLVTSVKGTVLEIRVREMIQAGEYPGLEGLPRDAALSESLTQRGHDVEVVDDDGRVIDWIQVKAGDWSGISPRIGEYASQGIPVAVTSEAAALAETAGHGDEVVDTGISAAELTSETEQIVSNLGLGHAVDELTPELAVVTMLAAASLRLRTGQSPREVRSWMTMELQTLGVANAAGLAIQLLTGVVLFRPAAALGARWSIARMRTATDTAIRLRAIRSEVATFRGVDPDRIAKSDRP